MIKYIKTIAAVLTAMTLCSCGGIDDPKIESSYEEYEEKPTAPATIILSDISGILESDNSDDNSEQNIEIETAEVNPIEDSTEDIAENPEIPTPDYKAAKCIDVPYRSQEDFPTGCELVSTSMLLGYYGFEIDPGELIDGGYVAAAEFEKIGDKIYGGDPNYVYIGNPRNETGFGCYSGAISDGLAKFLENEYFDSYYLTGMSMNDICSQYIDFGEPVLIWGSINMEPLYYMDGASWIIKDSGEKFTWLSNEHCMVLVGYDDYYYYIHDPLKSAYTPYERELVDMRFAEMGYQAVTIRPW